MPQFKDYPELTDVADDDALVILDVSDTTDSPAGSTKYIQASAFAPAGRVIKEEIARDTDPVSGDFDFTGLDLTLYDRVFAIGRLASAMVAVADGVAIFANGDETATNYWDQRVAGSGGNPNTNNGNSGFSFAATGTSALSDYAHFTADILFPGVTGQKMWSVESWFSESNGTERVEKRMMYSAITAPITSLKFTTTDGQALTGTIILYGERTA